MKKFSRRLFSALLVWGTILGSIFGAAARPSLLHANTHDSKTTAAQVGHDSLSIGVLRDKHSRGWQGLGSFNVSQQATTTEITIPAPEIPVATTVWGTWTATTSNIATGMATYTARFGLTPSSLLDRLISNKPSIWGSKAFHVSLAVVYLILLALFFREILRVSRQES